jgi:hypothetical protein
MPMSDERFKRGQFVSALGAALLGACVFLPWYGVTLTQSGVESARSAITGIAQQYGNATLQSDAGAVGAQFGSLTGRTLGTLSAHDVLKDLSVVLLILAAIGLVAALANLAGMARTGRGQIALVGAIAFIAVGFRMVDPPAAPDEVLALTLRWGAWLALAGSAAMVIGDLWLSSPRNEQQPQTELSQALEGLSGWTPPA